jgi:phosphotransferase system  glucose/maltose/N-acetylglucosamine-specific IIC component
MANHPQFDEIREEIEAKQRTVLFEDGLRAGKSVDDFLWKGDPNAKPIQRAGLVVFGLTFWLLGILLIAISWAKDEGIATVIGSLIGSAFVLVAIRLFWNAFLRPNKISKDEKDQQG